MPFDKIKHFMGISDLHSSRSVQLLQEQPQGSGRALGSLLIVTEFLISCHLCDQAR